jgi:hypothetical protein
MRKARAALDEVVAQELKSPALRVHSGLVVEGSVPEVKHEAGRHAFAPRKLDFVAISEKRAVGRPENEKAANGALG